MRIGKDAIIITKKNGTYTIALLSRTFLEAKYICYCPELR